jgi:hypothetical protein
MDCQEEQIAHELQVTTPVNPHKAKTAPERAFTLESGNSPPTGRKLCILDRGG